MKTKQASVLRAANVSCSGSDRRRLRVLPPTTHHTLDAAAAGTRVGPHAFMMSIAVSGHVQ